jgi:hydrogenase nickel incorporation protein HypA/HybF
MHESALAQSILDIAAATCRERGFSQIVSITLRVGKAAGVMLESLTFAFEAFKEDTVAKNARLIVESVPVGGACLDCGRDFEVDGAPYVFACPLCNSRSFTITRGREMEISELEVE